MRVLAVPLEFFAQEVLNGSRGYNLTFPLAPSSDVIGRVEEVYPDAGLQLNVVRKKLNVVADRGRRKLGYS